MSTTFNETFLAGDGRNYGFTARYKAAAVSLNLFITYWAEDSPAHRLNFVDASVIHFGPVDDARALGAAREALAKRLGAADVASRHAIDRRLGGTG